MNRFQAQGMPRGRGRFSRLRHRSQVLESPDARASGETRRSGPGQRHGDATLHCRVAGAGLGDGSTRRGLSRRLLRGRKAGCGLVVQGCRKRFLQSAYATGSPYYSMCTLQTGPRLTVVPTASFWCSSSFDRTALPTSSRRCLHASPAPLPEEAAGSWGETGAERNVETEGRGFPEVSQDQVPRLHPTEDGR